MKQGVKRKYHNDQNCQGKLSADSTRLQLEKNSVGMLNIKYKLLKTALRAYNTFLSEYSGGNKRRKFVVGGSLALPTIMFKLLSHFLPG